MISFLHAGFLDLLSTAQYSHFVLNSRQSSTLAVAAELRREEQLSSEDHVFPFWFSVLLIHF